MTDEALKPCPFCGGEAKYYYYTARDHNIECEICSNGTCLQNKAEAVTAWNTRADDDRIEALQAENAKLRDALFPFAEFHQLGGSMNDPISMWFRVAPFADAAYALQETER